MVSESRRETDPVRSPRPLTRLRAAREPGDDLLAAVAIVAVGTLLPLVVGGRYEYYLSLYLGPAQFAAIAAFGFGLVSWPLVDGLEIDRVTFAGSAIVAPWGVVAALLFAIAVAPWVETLVLLDSLPQYPFALGASGAAVVGCSLLSEQLSIRYSRVPGRRRVAFTACAAAVLGIGAVLGDRYRSPPVASIDDVDVEYGEYGVDVFVSLETESTAMHVTVVTPDGTTVRRRVTERGLEYDPFRVLVPRPEPDSDGRFDVRIVSSLGATIDSTSITVDGPSGEE